ncbi:MAG TPA: hypothetical protein VGX03_21800 [Candidatus Binatia bacterium]|nr:hypothetical protein [Candidatus Binatia bacterium]
MARPCRYATHKAEEWRAIDLADLRRWRMLDPAKVAMTGRIPAVTWNTPKGLDKLGIVAGQNGVLFVRRDDEGQLGKLFVPYVFTATQFGGRRAWFRCPGCGEGCRVLYGVNSLRCRTCRGLQYQSQYEMPAFRLLGRAYKIRRRLGEPGASGDPLPPKPRRMRWRRYHGLERLVSRLETAGWAALSAHVNGMGRKIR